MNSVIDKDFYTKSGDRLHYRQVNNSHATSLVLIHGQGMCGLDYETVMEKLSRSYDLYLVDCFGHGESEKKPDLYRCNIIGDAISEFISSEIARPCIISGHSSGGILAAYVAGQIPGYVKGLLLEDPPFFNVQPGEFENTFVYKDSFQVTHDFLNQTEEKEYLVYYLENGYIFNFLGQNYFGQDWAHKLSQEAREKLRAFPDELPSLKNVSAKSLHGFAYWNKFDYLFSESFYTGEWFDGVNQESILRHIKCPTVYLKAKTKYGKDGVLWAANTEEAAEKVVNLIKQCKMKVVRSGHDIHFEKPSKFIRAMKILDKMIKK